VAAVIGLALADRQGELAAGLIAIPAFVGLSVALRVFGDRERDLVRRALSRSASRV
jgi:hypothetical protein